MADAEQPAPRMLPSSKLRVRSMRIVVDQNGRHVDVALVDGADSDAMRAAVGAAIQDTIPPGDDWWLVDGEDELVVPLCSALPDGVSLALRTSSGRTTAQTCSFARAEESSSISRSLRQLFAGEDRTLSDFQRWSRLSTELANERTLLAWIRTALAAERTVFSFLGYKATEHLWHRIYIACTALLATVTVIFGFLGVERYYKIKKAITTAQPPGRYSRFTLQPALLALAVILAVVAIATYTRVLKKS